ncbi:MAG: transcriptional regulator [Desulfitibacter sp. BRH_c19]|nr:MAG: transcriptional regulator [Desulfitibacter sp. BRH_c19]
MNRLYQVKEKGQKVAEAIATVLNVEVEIVDEDLVRVAGTGRVKENIGSRMLRGLVNKKVLETGQYLYISSPGHHEICKKCTLAGGCFYKAYIVYPIKVKGEVIGNISLSAFNKEQEDKLRDQRVSMIDFVSKMADFISSKVIEKQMAADRTVMVNRLEAILDSVHEGVMAVDKSGYVTHLNKSSEQIFGLERSKVVGKNLNDLAPNLPLLDLLNGGEGFTYKEVFANFNTQKFHLLSTARPILSETKEVVGAVASYRDYSETQKNVYETFNKQQHLSFDDIIGSSASLQEVVKKAKKIASSNSTVLILGESGTGKELFARAVHEASTQRNKPFVSINCGAIPETLLESELFGYEEGAFTGAKRGGKIGKFELANSGTIFLDEISNMSLYLQAKLLRVLQERQIERVGGNQLVHVDIRVIAAANTDLQDLVTKGLFRDDLYYRLSVIPLEIPPLRERKEDIPQLLDYNRIRYGKLLNKKVIDFEKEALNVCLNYSWPGNVRELINTVEYAINIEESPIIQVESLPPRIWEDVNGKEVIDYDATGETVVKSLDEIEKDAIINALNHFGWSEQGKIKAAKALGTSRATIYRKIQKYKIEPEILN